MTSHKPSRKLAAVVFADIEGSTTLYQRDESSAISQVQRHRKDLEECAQKHNGEIIQFYGDGSVTIFDSVIDAVHSSIALQKLSISQGIPIRIGIHLGDLVFKDNDIFGDVVNVSSRIQSEGISGAILVSKKVADELINHPEIHLKPLGKYTLKNVDDDIDLYAITGSGLKVPSHQKAIKRNVFYPSKPQLILLTILALFLSYLIPRLKKSSLEKFTTERLGILPFENLTSNPALDKISTEIFIWITKELRDFVEPNTIMPSRSAIIYTNGDLSLFQKDPAFFRRTGCVYQIKGSFNHWGLKNDSLEFNSTVYEVRTGEAVLDLKKVYCASANPWDGIHQMANVIKGYWRSKKYKLLSAPTNDAFEAYTDALLKWGGPGEDEAKPDLLKAIRLDSSFIDPYFLLLDLFYNTKKPSNALDTLKLILFRFKDLDDRQKNYLRYHEEDINGRRVTAWKYFRNELLIDTLDPFYVTSGMVMGMEYLNDPKTTLRVDQYISNDSLNPNTCDYCRTKMLQAMNAHVALMQFEEAGSIADRVKLLVRRNGERIALIHYFMAIHDTVSTNTLLYRVEMDTTINQGIKSYLNLVAGREALLHGNIPLRNYYADRAIDAWKGKEARQLARCYYLKEDLNHALEIYEKTWMQEQGMSRQNLALGEMGLIYARLKQTEKANTIIIQLERRKDLFDYGEISYLQGRIKAHLGDIEGAIASLNKSLDEGQLFEPAVTFQYDPDLMILNTESDYIALLSRNIQN